jgi:hypothetical protein
MSLIACFAPRSTYEDRHSWLRGQDRSRNRQVPRVPSPASGVTSGGRRSNLLSTGITQPSSLLRTQAPVPFPHGGPGKPCAAGLCRLRSAPAGKRTFPTLSPLSVWCRPDPYLRCSSGACPFLPEGQRPRHRDNQLGTPNDLRTATSAEGNFRGCSHSLMFRLHHSLGPQVVPTARPPRVLGGQGIYTRPNSGCYRSRALASLRA